MKPAQDTSDERQLSLADRVTLPMALIVAITAALCIVLVAYWLYWNNDNRKYDIARAGQQTTTRITDDESTAVDVTSAVSIEDIKKKLNFLEKEVAAMDTVDGFEVEDLQDETIQLTAPTRE